MSNAAKQEKSVESNISPRDYISVPPNAKKFDDYERSNPEVMSFFERLSPMERGFSSTIELYDFIPKYQWEKEQRCIDKEVEFLEREFECRGAKYEVKIHPAGIEDGEGVEHYYYPSVHEELVEDVLRKLAAAGQGVFLNGQAGVTFSLSQIQQELEEIGHSYSREQIIESLLICARTQLTVTSENGAIITDSNLFQTLGLQTEDDSQGQNTANQTFVRFNSLVTESITNRTFRRLNYEKAMSCRNSIARQLYKRMSHHYTQASTTNPYHILLSTIIRNLGLTQSSQLENNLRDAQNGLNEMIEKKVILSYEVERLLKKSGSADIIDAKFILFPDPSFVDEVISTNRIQAKMKSTPI